LIHHKLDKPLVQKSLDAYYEIVRQGGAASQVAFASTRSFDFEAIVENPNKNFNRSSKKVIEAGLFDPADPMGSVERTHFYNYPKQELGQIIKEEARGGVDSFWTDRNTQAAAHGFNYRGNAGGNFKGGFSRINDILKTSHVGAYNLDFEMSALLQGHNNPADAAGLVFGAKEGVAFDADLYSNYGKIFGNDVQVSKAVALSEQASSIFRAGEFSSEADKILAYRHARDAQIGAAEAIATRLTSPSTGPNLLHDQLEVTKGFLAKMQRRTGVDFGDFSSGTSIDALLKSASAISETHISTLDSGAGQALTSNLAGEMLKDDADEVGTIGKRIFDDLLQNQKVRREAQVDKGVATLFNDQEGKMYYSTRGAGEIKEQILSQVQEDGTVSEVGRYGTATSKYSGGLSRDFVVEAARGTREEFESAVRPTIETHFAGNNALTAGQAQDLAERSISTMYEGARGILRKPVEELAEKSVPTTSIPSKLGSIVDELGIKPTHVFAGIVGAGVGVLALRQAFFGPPSMDHDSLLMNNPVGHGINRSSSNPSDFNSPRAKFNPHSMGIAYALAALGIGTAAIYGARSAGQFIDADTSQWGRASRFGISSRNMWGAVSEEYEEEMDAKGHSITTHGTYIHAMYQKNLEALYPDTVSEYAVVDTDVKLTGHIDVVAPMRLHGSDGPVTPIPVEIKTIAGDKLSGMTGPKAEHKAQSQFYLHHLTKKYNTNVPYETFIYISRDDPSKFKIFHERRDERLFQHYLKRYRAYQKEVQLNGYTPQEVTSPLSVIAETFQQRDQVSRMENTSSGFTPKDLRNAITETAASYNPRRYGGIDRTDRHRYDFDSPHKKVWNAPSADLAAQNRSGSAPRIATIKRRGTSTMPMTGYNERSKLGQSAKYTNRRPKSAPRNSSRSGVV
jgi:hypothetical protein